MTISFLGEGIPEHLERDVSYWFRGAPYVEKFEIFIKAQRRENQ